MTQPDAPTQDPEPPSPPGGDAHRSGALRRWSVRTLAVIGALAIVVVAVVVGVVWYQIGRADRDLAQHQDEIGPFYRPPADLPTGPGRLIRSEPLGYDVPNGQGHRILYTSQDASGAVVAVSGMVFVPDVAPPTGGRKVVAWAHPTVGLADQCAPSRAMDPLTDTSGWLGLMLERGWVVTATDYYGLGTPGPATYLIGQQEAKDVVNSVRAAQALEGTAAGDDWIVWGHSQGGHSALWTGALADQLAPELRLLAVGAAAPAQQLETIVAEQWRNRAGWVLGSAVVAGFDAAYPQLPLEDGLSSAGRSRLAGLTNECELKAMLQAEVDNTIRGPFFADDPLGDPNWVATIQQQTPPMPSRPLPVFLTEGTADTVVLAASNAGMQQQWCSAGVDLRVAWLGGIGHMAVANTAGPLFVDWAADRFAGTPNQRNCATPPAVPAATPPTVAANVQAQADAIKQQNPLPPLLPAGAPRP